MRTCCRCGQQLQFPVVTVSFATEYDHWTGWFCSKPCANEYLTQEIAEDQQEAAKQ